MAKKKGRAEDLLGVEERRMKTFLVLRMEREGKRMRGKIDRRS